MYGKATGGVVELAKDLVRTRDSPSRSQGRAALRKPGNGFDELFLRGRKGAGKEVVRSLSEFNGETFLLGGEEIAEIAHGALGVRHGFAQGFDPALRLLDGKKERLPPLLDLLDDPGA